MVVMGSSKQKYRECQDWFFADMGRQGWARLLSRLSGNNDETSGIYFHAGIGLKKSP